MAYTRWHGLGENGGGGADSGVDPSGAEGANPPGSAGPGGSVGPPGSGQESGDSPASAIDRDRASQSRDVSMGNVAPEASTPGVPRVGVAVDLGFVRWSRNPDGSYSYGVGVPGIFHVGYNTNGSVTASVGPFSATFGTQGLTLGTGEPPGAPGGGPAPDPAGREGGGTGPMVPIIPGLPDPATSPVAAAFVPTVSAGEAAAVNVPWGLLAVGAGAVVIARQRRTGRR